MHAPLAAVGFLALAPGAWADVGWDAITLSDSVASFGSVSTGQTYSVLMTITNNLEASVHVTDAAFDEDVFTTDLAGLVPLEVPPQGTSDFHVYFDAEHNVNYTDFLRLELDGGLRPLVARVSAQAHYPDTYYACTQNKWAEELKDALTDLIDDHTSLGYNTARDSMYGHIDNVDGWIECVYTGRKAFFNTRAGATANGFNCEHTWPQSFSNEAEPMKSDIFHLYPTDETANNKRADLDFGVVASATWSVGGSKLGADAYGQQVFEPRDAHKGNVARTHFYYVIRYNGAYNLYQNPAKMEAHFRVWHLADPVDSAEQARNEHIYDLQENRNPFIDHPELADRISSFFGNAVREIRPEIAVSPAAVSMGRMGFDSTASYYLAVANSGDDTLEVASITSTDPDFEVGTDCLSLGPDSYAYVRIAYTSGQAPGVDSTLIVLLSNDDDEASVGIPVAVEVVDCAGFAGRDAAGQIPYLHQNCPNPFGERTILMFDVAEGSAVDLSVYNTAGQLVRRLFRSDRVAPGRYRSELVADGLASGVYYCRLTAGEHVATRPLVLLAH